MGDRVLTVWQGDGYWHFTTKNIQNANYSYLSSRYQRILPISVLMTMEISVSYPRLNCYSPISFFKIQQNLENSSKSQLEHKLVGYDYLKMVGVQLLWIIQLNHKHKYSLTFNRQIEKRKNTYDNPRKLQFRRWIIQEGISLMIRIHFDQSKDQIPYFSQSKVVNLLKIFKVNGQIRNIMKIYISILGSLLFQRCLQVPHKFFNTDFNNATCLSFLNKWVGIRQMLRQVSAIFLEFKCLQGTMRADKSIKVFSINGKLKFESTNANKKEIYQI
ncbi:hypothetical protein pb186bvf_016640 [Paramecium bursaria]